MLFFLMFVWTSFVIRTHGVKKAIKEMLIHGINLSPFSFTFFLPTKKFTQTHLEYWLVAVRAT